MSPPKKTWRRQTRELVQELEFYAIDWVEVHKLWALERPGVPAPQVPPTASLRACVSGVLK
jgi:hypothetical protein